MNDPGKNKAAPGEGATDKQTFILRQLRDYLKDTPEGKDGLRLLEGIDAKLAAMAAGVYVEMRCRLAMKPWANEVMTYVPNPDEGLSRIYVYAAPDDWMLLEGSREITGALLIGIQFLIGEQYEVKRIDENKTEGGLN
jgi:hypothetical protein